MAGLGEVIVSGLVGPVVRKAASLAQDEIVRLWGVDEQIRSLSGKLGFIRTVLNDVDDVGHFRSEAMRAWLRRLRKVAYDIDDLLDDCATLGLRVEEEEEARGWLRRLSDSLCHAVDCLLFLWPQISSSTRAPMRPELGGRIRSITDRLNEIERDQQYLNLRSLADESPRMSRRPRDKRRQETTALLELPPVGRKAALKQIKGKLLACSLGVGDGEPSSSSGVRSSKQTNMSYVAIVGMGGVGKTTLAQAIFNDGEVKARFKDRMRWVFVGEDFDPNRIIREIIREPGDAECSLNDLQSRLMERGDAECSLNDLQSKLMKKLRAGTYLIVLDDVWSNNVDEWDTLWTPFLQSEVKGVAVVVTTREEEVAKTKTKNPASIHTLGTLEDNECMKIFKRYAFAGENDDKKYPNLVRFCQPIVQRLKGIPLAAKLMGTFLGGFLDKEEKWESVVNNEAWPEMGGDDLINRVVALSYEHLPGHLKLCFAYCSIFPKDFVFDRKRLVQMWMAHDFIQPEGNRRIEDIGEDYFDDLLQRSFFQYVNFKYVMHDVVNDFAQKVFEEGWQTSAARACSRSEYVRHLSVSCDRVLEEDDVKQLKKFKKLRTLHLKCVGPASYVDVLLEGFRYIRVLQLVGWEIKELPDSIRHLCFLQYLDISGTGIQSSLPPVICSLRSSLRTLMVEWSCGFPEGMSELVNLRHLRGAGAYSISRIKGLGQLTALQELGLFRVERESGREITELKKMNHLRGPLTIEGLENVGDREEAEQANLKDKVHLDDLTLGWTRQPVEGECTVDSQVLEGLRPPPNITRLEIKGNLGVELPRWMKEPQQLPFYLERLDLEGCFYWEGLPALGQLTGLRHLHIKRARRVKKVGPDDFYGTMTNSSSCQDNKVSIFPALRVLSFGGMDEWEEWIVGLEEGGASGSQVVLSPSLPVRCRVEFFPSLSELEIEDCPKLRVLPLEDLASTSSTLKKLKIRGCPSLDIAGRSCSQYSMDDYGHRDEADDKEGCPLEQLETDNRQVLGWLLLPHRKKLLSSLVRLHIEKCEELHHFTAAEEAGWTHLVSLQLLQVKRCENLRSLPSNVHALRSLQKLDLSGCSKLRSLPSDLRSLSSLQQLNLRDCPMIQCLPDAGLPTSLWVLIITGCPSLITSCERGGPDHQKISRVRHVCTTELWRVPAVADAVAGPEMAAAFEVMFEAVRLEKARLWEEED